ncbi:MAG TPA: hypothetical protein VK961_25865 [Chthoniobacter sp.]|nr:hypothetical protein [Chthoniobacter sp.]
MSAAEIIEQIKALPLEEQREVFSFVREAEKESASVNGQGVRYVDDRTFDVAVERVFEQHSELFKKLAE